MFHHPILVEIGRLNAFIVAWKDNLMTVLSWNDLIRSAARSNLGSSIST